MTNLTRWDRAMAKQMKAVEKAVQSQHLELVSVVYKAVLSLSPVYSGYYKANHRISFDGLVELSPSVRTGVKGAHFDQIEITKANEVAKLSFKALPVVVTIGNAVSYAGAMEDPSGAGVTPVTGVRPVYANARILGIEEFKRGRA